MMNWEPTYFNSCGRRLDVFLEEVESEVLCDGKCNDYEQETTS